MCSRKGEIEQRVLEILIGGTWAITSYTPGAVRCVGPANPIREVSLGGNYGCLRVVVRTSMRRRFYRREYVEYHCFRGHRQSTPQREFRTFDALSVAKQVGEVATGNRKNVTMDITIDQALNDSSSLIRSQRFNFVRSSRETSQGSKTLLRRNSVLSWKPNSVSIL